jgi:hypothetical protein
MSKVVQALEHKRLIVRATPRQRRGASRHYSQSCAALNDVKDTDDSNHRCGPNPQQTNLRTDAREAALSWHPAGTANCYSLVLGLGSHTLRYILVAFPLARR